MRKLFIVNPHVVMRYGLALLVMCYALSTSAYEKTIEAVYTPDPNNPTSTTFVLLTPGEGKCSLSMYCNGALGLQLPVVFESAMGIDVTANANDPRQGAYFKIPRAWRSVMLVNNETGSQAELKVRAAAVGARYVLIQPAYELSPGGPTVPNYGHGLLWQGGTWHESVAPCFSSRLWYLVPKVHEFFWQYRTSDTCTKKALFDIPGPFIYNRVETAFEFAMPNPLDMEPGNYTASTLYSVGPGQDFDFGQLMLPSDSQITLDFSFVVNGALSVEFPPGSYRAVLQPREGWQGWLNSGRKPPALSAFQNFKISASSHFKMYLDCQYSVGTDCGLHAESATQNAQVAVDTTVSFAAGITLSPGRRAAIKVPLAQGIHNAVSFDIDGAQVSRGASMNYAIKPEVTALMVENPGSTYSGVVTIVFDIST